MSKSIINTYTKLLQFISDNQMFFCILNDDYIPTENEIIGIIGIIDNHGYYVIGDTVYQYTLDT